MSISSFSFGNIFRPQQQVGMAVCIFLFVSLSCLPHSQLVATAFLLTFFFWLKVFIAYIILVAMSTFAYTSLIDRIDRENIVIPLQRPLWLFPSILDTIPTRRALKRVFPWLSLWRNENIYRNNKAHGTEVFANLGYLGTLLNYAFLFLCGLTSRPISRATSAGYPAWCYLIGRKNA